jgi:hypothetical protein
MSSSITQSARSAQWPVLHHEWPISASTAESREQAMADFKTAWQRKSVEVRRPSN